MIFFTENVQLDGTWGLQNTSGFNPFSSERRLLPCSQGT